MGYCNFAATFVFLPFYKINLLFNMAKMVIVLYVMATSNEGDTVIYCFTTMTNSKGNLEFAIDDIFDWKTLPVPWLDGNLLLL